MFNKWIGKVDAETACGGTIVGLIGNPWFFIGTVAYAQGSGNRC